MEQFHGAKRQLLGYVEKHRADLPENVRQAMERQVHDLKIQRPPAADEPDLAWRGIGIYTLNSESEPIIKLGGGFVRLAIKHPARARFEMARLVAQAWAPCELERLAASEAPWNGLLKCLSVNDAQGCAQGTFSEAGWAVATSVAYEVSAPGCQIPAFRAPEQAKCAAHATRAVASVTNSASAPVSEGAQQ
jgi:hypothetical protein